MPELSRVSSRHGVIGIQNKHATPLLENLATEDNTEIERKKKQGSHH
jgi:hypothetical protein